MPEVGGEAVLYISGKDTAETSSLLSRIYNDENLRKTLKINGLARAKKFDWQKTANTMINVVVNEIKGDKND